jgi:hypothetical protein
MKTCKKCLEEKPESLFYRCRGNTDGLHGSCKECIKATTRANYAKNIKARADYDKMREKQPERKAKRAKYQQTLRNKKRQQYLANTMTTNAIRDNRLTKQPCIVCGASKVEAHHKDYYKPLEVTWLCKAHHLHVHGKQDRELHSNN